MNHPCMTDRCQGGMCRQDPVTSGTGCTQSSDTAGVCNASEEALAGCLVWLMAPELGVRPFLA